MNVNKTYNMAWKQRALVRHQPINFGGRKDLGNKFGRLESCTFKIFLRPRKPLLYPVKYSASLFPTRGLGLEIQYKYQTHAGNSLQ